MIYEEDVRRILEKRLEQEGLNKFAQKHNISAAFVSDVKHGKRNVTQRIADILGYVRFVGFKKKGK